MTKPGRPQAVSDQDIVDAIRAAVEAGQTDLLDGGVPTGVVADRVGYHESTVESRLRALADEGRVVQVDGANPESYQARVSYQLAEGETSTVEP